METGSGLPPQLRAMTSVSFAAICGSVNGLGNEVQAGLQRAVVHDRIAGEAGRVQHLEIGPPPLGLGCRLPAVDVGHDDIGEQQFRDGMGIEPVLRLPTTAPAGMAMDNC